MAKKRYSSKPTMPKDSAPVAEWKQYQKDLAQWEKDQEEKEKLIREIRSKNGSKKRKR